LAQLCVRHISSLEIHWYFCMFKGMANWIPSNHSILYTGQGGYGSNNAELHLKYVSKQLNLDYNNMGGLGSTWYGNAKLMVATANLTISVMRWLTTQVSCVYIILEFFFAFTWKNFFRSSRLLKNAAVALRVGHIGTGLSYYFMVDTLLWITWGQMGL